MPAAASENAPCKSMEKLFGAAPYDGLANRRCSEWRAIVGWIEHDRHPIRKRQDSVALREAILRLWMKRAGRNGIGTAPQRSDGEPKHGRNGSGTARWKDQLPVSRSCRLTGPKRRPGNRGRRFLRQGPQPSARAARRKIGKRRDRRVGPPPAWSRPDATSITMQMHPGAEARQVLVKASPRPVPKRPMASWLPAPAERRDGEERPHGVGHGPVTYRSRKANRGRQRCRPLFRAAGSGRTAGHFRPTADPGDGRSQIERAVRDDRMQDPQPPRHPGLDPGSRFLLPRAQARKDSGAPDQVRGDGGRLAR